MTHIKGATIVTWIPVTAA